MKKNLVITLIFSFLLLSCQALRHEKVDTRDRPSSGIERARQNVNEGRGVSIGGLIGNKGGSFEFSSSNPMWRASLEVLDFLPMTTVDYSGGMIISDWYTDNNAQGDESIKITIRFLSNEVRSDAIDVDIFYKKCIATNNCKINKQDGQLKKEITKQILARAAIYKKQSKDKNYRPYRSSSNDNERQE